MLCVCACKLLTCWRTVGHSDVTAEVCWRESSIEECREGHDGRGADACREKKEDKEEKEEKEKEEEFK